jgi:threonylcarbamoyladenosine tRNA methylthiotransferase MtaB
MFAQSLKLVEDCDLTFLHVFPFSPRKGTPAARMPQVKGPLIKDRAARLRAAGDAALLRHLSAQQGVSHRILLESARMGRTEQFTEVCFATDQAEGQIVTAVIQGAEAGRLLV